MVWGERLQSYHSMTQGDAIEDLLVTVRGGQGGMQGHPSPGRQKVCLYTHLSTQTEMNLNALSLTRGVTLKYKKVRCSQQVYYMNIVKGLVIKLFNKYYCISTPMTLALCLIMIIFMCLHFSFKMF